MWHHKMPVRELISDTGVIKAITTCTESHYMGAVQSSHYG